MESWAGPGNGTVLSASGCKFVLHNLHLATVGVHVYGCLANQLGLPLSE